MRVGYLLMASILFILWYLIFKNKETVGFVHAGYASTSLLVGIAILVAYVGALYKPRISSLSAIGTFFNDRMYLPYLNDYIIPKIGFFVAHLVHDYGNRGIDGFFNTKVMPGLFGLISRGIRRIQSGYLAHYIKVVLGVVMMILILAAIGGVYLYP